MGLLHMLGLGGNGTNMPVMRRGFFGGGRSRRESTLAPVVADPAHRRVIDGRVIDVVDVVDIHVQYGTIVEKMSVVPTPTVKANSKVAEAVVDAAIKPDGRPPIAIVENETSAAPAPISGCPQEADFGSHHPRTRHPVIVVKIVAPAPVTWRPEVAVPRADRLLINRQRGWSESNDDAHRGKCRCRHAR